MHQILKSVVFAAIIISFAVPAFCFDLVVPARVRVWSAGYDELVAASWGWVVATTEPIYCADLPQGNTPGTDDNPQVEFFTSAFSNCNLYSPVQPGGIIGCTCDQTPILTPFLNPGEFFVAPNLQEPAIGIINEDNITNVTVTAVLHYDIAGQHAEYTVIFEFVPTEIEGYIEILEGQRVSSVPIQPTAAEPSSWGQLKTRFIER
jgi:hypothetical protein